MTISEFGDLGDIVASIGVVASLIFVGLQVRQSARLTRASAVQGSADYISTFFLEIAKNPQLRRVASGLDHLSREGLDAEDRYVAEVLIGGLFAWADRVHVQMQEGLLPLAYWAECRGLLRAQVFTSPMVREWWARVALPAEQYSAPFRDEVSREIATVGTGHSLPRVDLGVSSRSDERRARNSERASWRNRSLLARLFGRRSSTTPRPFAGVAFVVPVRAIEEQPALGA